MIVIHLLLLIAISLEHFLFDSGSSGCSHGNNSSCEIDNPTLNSFYDANCELNPYFSYIRVIYHPNEITTGCTLNSTPGTIEYELSSSPKYTTGDCPYPISSVIGGTLSNGSASIVYKDYELYGNCGCQIREK
ncbi:MAG: hypothetical protein IPI96_15175 [Saprospiraceae bacterium]|nr:hypothetical protein [Saprospiraceae bacterium]